MVAVRLCAMAVIRDYNHRTLIAATILPGLEGTSPRSILVSCRVKRKACRELQM
jgi:hypothetical protein